MTLWGVVEPRLLQLFDLNNGVVATQQRAFNNGVGNPLAVPHRTWRENRLRHSVISGKD